MDDRRLTARRRCTGVILAGGASARMGGAPKGLRHVGTLRMIDHVAAALATAADSVVLAANDPDAAAWLPSAPVIPDVRTGFGALGGIHAALHAAGTDVLVLAWDLPFVSGALLRAIRDAGELHDADAAAPASESPWGFEPLAAWYSNSALDVIATMLDSGDARAGALRERANLLTVDVSSWGDANNVFFNVNTPDDLVRANAIVDAAATGSPVREPDRK